MLGDAILKEPELFFTELINENPSLTNLIDSDFTFVNRRLATHYGISDVTHGASGLDGEAEAQSRCRKTSVLFGSNLGNANAHHARNLPIFLAGGGFKHGHYVAEREGTPLCNLFVTMLNNMGLETDSFGQSTGELSCNTGFKTGRRERVAGALHENDSEVLGSARRCSP